MVKPKNILILCCFVIVLTINSYCQEKMLGLYGISGNFKQINEGPFSVYVDTLTLDTLFHDYYSQPWQKIIKTKDNIELLRGNLHGGMGTECGCSPLPNGLWVKRYRNGNLQEQGEYVCNRKKGKWVYYYENGNLQREETYRLPYLVSLQYDYRLRNREYLLDGMYSEYYKNGKLKEEGKYKIVEKFSSKDTLWEYQDGRMKKTVIEGKFWYPISIKIGVWKSVDENGKIIRKIHYEPFKWLNKKYRTIECRYKELKSQNKNMSDKCSESSASTSSTA